jgi:hypothetical protein
MWICVFYCFTECLKYIYIYIYKYMYIYVCSHFFNLLTPLLKARLYLYWYTTARDFQDNEPWVLDTSQILYSQRPEHRCHENIILISLGTVHILRKQPEGGREGVWKCWQLLTEGEGGLNLADVSKLTKNVTYLSNKNFAAVKPRTNDFPTT